MTCHGSFSGRRRRYCSEPCKPSGQRHNLLAAPERRVCLECAARFITGYARQVFCSAKCRIRVSDRRRWLREKASTDPKSLNLTDLRHGGHAVLGAEARNA